MNGISHGHNRDNISRGKFQAPLQSLVRRDHCHRGQHSINSQPPLLGNLQPTVPVIAAEPGLA